MKIIDKKSALNVLFVFGTRPEAIKMAPLIRAANAHPKFSSKVCVTAQHREMLDQVLSLFEIVPDMDLDLMTPDQDLFDITARIILAMKEVLLKCKPDVVLVQGDTTTAFTAALAAFYLKIPIGHIEAGLRTGDLLAPFPEEANRCLVSSLASMHFCPTETSFNNLDREGVEKTNIWITGNTVIDALMWVKEKVEKLPANTWQSLWGDVTEILEKEYPLILITGHRRENFGDRFETICRALKNLALRNQHWRFVYPVHLNPNVIRPVKKILGNIPNIFLIEPMDYKPFVYLMSNAKLILTDSGGIQEEAPSLGKPVLVMRDTTERPEAVTMGTVKLVGADYDNIINSAEEIMNDKKLYNQMAMATNPYGDGYAAQRIVGVLLDKFESGFFNLRGYPQNSH